MAESLENLQRQMNWLKDCLGQHQASTPPAASAAAFDPTRESGPYLCPVRTAPPIMQQLQYLQWQLPQTANQLQMWEQAICKVTASLDIDCPRKPPTAQQEKSSGQHLPSTLPSVQQSCAGLLPGATIAQPPRSGSASAQPSQFCPVSHKQFVTKWKRSQFAAWLDERADVTGPPLDHLDAYLKGTVLQLPGITTIEQMSCFQMRCNWAGHV